jgi:hypothetical protein
MNHDEARRVAQLSAPGDPVQQAIIEAALSEVGEGVVTVREVPDGDPPWQAFRNGKPLSFAGMFIYGGPTRELALEEARRIAGKWDWPVDDRMEVSDA